MPARQPAASSAAPRRRDQDLGQVDVHRPLDDRRDRPPRPRLVDEIVAVDVLARDRDEQGGAADQPRIVGEARCDEPCVGAFEGVAGGRRSTKALGVEAAHELGERAAGLRLRGRESRGVGVVHRRT